MEEELQKEILFMEDVCSATYLLMKKGVIGEYYHISGNELISIRELVTKICDMLNVKFEDSVKIIDDRVGKILYYKLNSSKINKLGWKDLIKLENGLLKTIKWVKDNYDFLKHEPDEYIHKQ